MSMQRQLDLFKNNLPRKPYCSNDLEAGLVIRSAEYASKFKYIQPNHPNSKLWLLFDIDRSTGPEELTDDFWLPPPTFWVQNKKNNHAHALYALEQPIHFNRNSSPKAIRYAAAVDVAMSVKMDADPNYAGLICKNPLNEHWRTYSYGSVYDLHDLSEYLDLSVYKDRRKNLPQIGLGRNCTLFDRLRHYAYKEIRKGYLNYDQWLDVIEKKACSYNDFDKSLELKEVLAISKSVAKWTFNNFSKAGYDAYIKRLIENTHTPEMQSKRGKRSGEVRAKKSNERAKIAHELREKGLKQGAIAHELGVSERTVRNLLKNRK